MPLLGGLTLQETAEVLDVSLKTVQRDWLRARAWLRKEVERDLLDAEPQAEPGEAKGAPDDAPGSPHPADRPPR